MIIIPRLSSNKEKRITMSIPYAISVILSIVLLCIGGMIHELTAAEASNGKLIEIDLDIFNGQDGAEVIDDKEVTIGAFTVANINNTDGNSDANGAPGIDRDQVTVPGEVDLMKMIIRKPSRNITGVKLTLTKESGSAKVYSANTKGTEITLPHEYTYEEIGEGVTLWVEATAPSKDVRDIAFKIVYSTADDTVNATGIWATKTDFRNDLAQTTLWTDANEAVLKLVFSEVFVSKFGIKYSTPAVQYSMGMEFTVSPPGIGSEPGVKFDITRQKEKRSWTIDGATVTQEDNEYWPKLSAFSSGGPTGASVDVANDDNDAGDEDNAPTQNHIYTLDAPQHANDGAHDQYVRRLNFLEFVRIRVDGTSPSGNRTDGSRCSPKAPWYASMWSVKYVSGTISVYLERVGKGNAITEGYNAILPAPTP